MKKSFLHRRPVTPDIFQTEASECGACCLQMILRYYHLFVPNEEVREACAVSRNGCNAANILDAGERYGFEVHGYSYGMEKLKDMPKPCIIHWNFNHFVVLEHMSDRHAWINDPAAGRRKITIGELDDAFTGIILCMKPGPDFKPRGRETSLVGAMRDVIQGEESTVFFLLTISVALVITGLIFPIMTQLFVDHVIGDMEYGMLGIVLGGMILVYGVQILMNAMQNSVLAKLRIKLTLQSDRRLFARMLHFPVSFFEQRFIGELSQREEAVNQLYSFAAGSFSNVILKSLQSVVYLVMLLLCSLPLALVSLIGAVTAMLFIRVSNRVLSKYAQKQFQDSNRFMGMLCAFITAFSSVKAAGAENTLVTTLSEKYALSSKSEQKMAMVQQILTSIPSQITQMLNVMILMFGGILVMRGQLTVGVLFAFTQLFSMFIQPTMGLLSMQQQIQTLKANFSALQDLEQAKEDERYANAEAANKPEADKVVEGRLEARRLTFGYDRSAEPIVRNFSLRMEAGSVIGIVGASGSGKSTVGKLLSGLVPAWSGSLLLDDIPLEEYTGDVLSESVSVVSQKGAFFAASIRDNLTLWSKHYSDDKIYQALKEAEALDLVSTLPGGMEYQLQEGARNLSGGQRQQLAIARALLCDPAVLILDEATSAMDAPREKAIMDNLRRRNCTIIIIAHRLSSVITADLILVMEKGCVVEMGNHERLMEAKGYYSRLYRTKETA